MRLVILKKELLLIKGADHAECYYVDTVAYENAVKKMIEKYTLIM